MNVARMGLRQIELLLWVTGALSVIAAVGAVSGGAWLAGALIAPAPLATGYVLWRARTVRKAN